MPDFNKGDFTQQGVDGYVEGSLLLNQKRDLTAKISTDEESDSLSSVTIKIHDHLNDVDYTFNGENISTGSSVISGEIPSPVDNLKNILDSDSGVLLESHPTGVRPYAFYNFNGDANAVDFKNVETLGSYAFSYGASMPANRDKGVHIDSLVFEKEITLTSSWYAFGYCCNIKEIIMKNQTILHGTGSSGKPFQNSYCESIRIPKCTGFNTSSHDSYFSCGTNASDPNLYLLDLGLITNLNSERMLQNQSKLTVLIFRNTSQVRHPISANYIATQGCSLLASGQGCRIYVPAALKSSYERDSVWSTITTNNPSVKFFDLEGSLYEDPDFTYTRPDPIVA